VRVGGDLHNTEVNAKHAVNGFFVFLRHVTGGEQVERRFSVSALAVDQVALALLVLHQAGVMLSDGVRDVLPSTKRPDAHLTLFVGQEAAVVGDTTALPKRALRVPVELVAISHLAETAYHHLS